jgi:tRNA 2-thiouridine synthesizing protein E
MLDINKAIENDRNARYPDPEGHMYDLAPWTYATAQHQADAEGLGDLTDRQWRVIHALRRLFRKNGRAASSRQLIRSLDNTFAREPGFQDLYQMFPQGPVIQGSRLAGVPPPP